MNLDFLTDDKYRYYKEVLDSNPQVSLGESRGNRRRAQAVERYVDVNVPTIDEGLAYSRKDLAKVEKGRLPVSRQVQRVIAKMAEVEERFFFAGDPKLGSTTGAYEITNSNNHTDWGSDNFDTADVSVCRTSLGSGLGVAFDHYKERLKDFPIFLAVSNDVYKEILLLNNQYTDANVFELLTNDLKRVGMQTGLMNHVFSSKYLFGQAGELGIKGGDVYLKTEGTECAALVIGDPDAWGIDTSRIDQNPFSREGGIAIDLGYSFVPYFKKANAIILDQNVELAAQ